MGWAVLLTQPNRWRTAEEHVSRQGFECWFPKTSKTELLFPRYGFVLVVSAWHALLSTLGVSDVLRSGEKPMFVPEHGERGLAALRARERVVGRERDGTPIRLVVLPPRQRFSPGEPVRVEEDGIYFGASALYEGMPREGRAAVLLTFMGHPAHYELDDEALSPA